MIVGEFKYCKIKIFCARLLQDFFLHLEKQINTVPLFVLSLTRGFYFFPLQEDFIKDPFAATQLDNNQIYKACILESVIFTNRPKPLFREESNLILGLGFQANTRNLVFIHDHSKKC